MNSSRTQIELSLTTLGSNTEFDRYLRNPAKPTILLSSRNKDTCRTHPTSNIPVSEALEEPQQSNLYIDLYPILTFRKCANNRGVSSSKRQQLQLS